MLPRSRFLLCALLFAATAGAQDEGPAVDTSGAGAAPPDREEGPAVASPSEGSDGTSIIGDSESPIGLYIIPWRGSSATPQLDRPARFVDAAEEPVDETQFRRYVEYHEALMRHRSGQRRDGAAE